MCAVCLPASGPLHMQFLPPGLPFPGFLGISLPPISKSHLYDIFVQMGSSSQECPTSWPSHTPSSSVFENPLHPQKLPLCSEALSTLTLLENFSVFQAHVDRPLPLTDSLSEHLLGIYCELGT